MVKIVTIRDLQKRADLERQAQDMQSDDEYNKDFEELEIVRKKLKERTQQWSENKSSSEPKKVATQVSLIQPNAVIDQSNDIKKYFNNKNICISFGVTIAFALVISSIAFFILGPLGILIGCSAGILAGSLTALAIVAYNQKTNQSNSIY